MQVKDITVEQLTALIRHTVEQCLEEYFGDPDSEKEIKEELKQQLRDSLKRSKSGERGIPADEVYKKLGMKQQ